MTYKEALEWIINDANYKPPEDFSDVTERWVDIARQTLEENEPKSIELTTAELTMGLAIVQNFLLNFESTGRAENKALAESIEEKILEARGKKDGPIKERMT